jgi:hypothetical protein
MEQTHQQGFGDLLPGQAYASLVSFHLFYK